MKGRSVIRRLAAAATISVLGSEAAFVALGVEMYQRTQSTVWLASMLLATFGITGVIKPFAGALGDRFDRKRLMITSDLLGALAFAALGFINSPSLLLGIAFFAAVVETPFSPAASAALPNLVEESDLAWGNGVMGAASTIGATVGPALGGLLVGLAGAAAVCWLNAGSFVVSALLVASVHARFSKGEHSREMTHSPLAGFRHLRSDRLLIGIAVYWGLSFFAVDLILVANLPLADSFHVGSFGYSLFLTVWAGGGIIGYTLARKLKPSFERGALVAGSVAIAVGFSITAISPIFAMALFGVGLAALFDAIGTVGGFTLVQRGTPDGIRARVFGSLSAIGWTSNAIAFVVAGFLVGAIGPRWVYEIGAATALVGTLTLVTCLTPWRQQQEHSPKQTALEAQPDRGQASSEPR